MTSITLNLIEIDAVTTARRMCKDKLNKYEFVFCDISNKTS